MHAGGGSDPPNAGIADTSICTAEDYERVPSTLRYPYRGDFASLNVDATQSFAFADLQAMDPVARQDTCANTLGQMKGLLTRSVATDYLDNALFFQRQFPGPSRATDSIFQLGYMLWDHRDACPDTHRALDRQVRPLRTERPRHAQEKG